ncbi:MAG: hypothetical protein PF487_11815 [Bacteroidales bacterium]|jgi:hypothetical protein|nr:hypothetical protein [Bacteroidales bacterium]
MKTSKFYIGTFKNGQDFARIIDNFGHETIKNATNELIKMYNSIDFDDDDFDSKLSEETLRELLQFSEDTTNWGIFKLSENEENGEIETAITKSWGSRNFTSNQL